MHFLRQIVQALSQIVKQRLRQWTKPDNHTLVLNTALDLTRPKSELMLEDLLLRQQLIVMGRQVERPRLTWRDRTLLVFWASKLRTWKETPVIVQPETVLRWHRELFKRFWKRKSKPQQKQGGPLLKDDLVALIKRIVKENLTWGQSGFGESCSSWGFESARARFKRI
jgi:putative transposase